MAPLRFVSDMSPRAVTASALLLVVCAAVLAFLPTWHNGFLIAGFDDQLVLDDPHVRQLDAAHLWGLLTSFRHANYVPLTMLTFALQYPFAGLDPAPYHLVNILLHAANAALVWWLVRRLIGNPTSTRPIGGNIVGHTATFRLYLRKSKAGKRVARLVDSPNLPEGEAAFMVEQAGLKPC